MTNKVTEGGVISTELNQDILENPTENADNDDDLEQIELKVASIVREREERASMDSNTSKKSEEQVSQIDISNTTVTTLLFFSKAGATLYWKLELFFAMIESEVTLEMIPGWKLFLAEIILMVAAFLFDCLSLGNVKRKSQKLLNFVMSSSDVT